MPNNGLDIATLLARTGGAISQDGSWQQNLAQAAGETAANEQERQFLADMLGGGVPDPTGRFGLSPDTVLKGLQLRHQIEQSRPKEVPMSTIDTPWGAETMPTSEVPEYRRKIYNEQNEATPSGIRTFREFQQMDEEEQKEFMEFSKSQQDKSFEQTMAEYLIKRREAAKQDKEMEAKLELGTPEHKQDVKDRMEDSTFSRSYNEWAERRAAQGKKVLSSDVYKDAKALQIMAQEMEDARDDVTNVRYGRGPEGEGFYGTKDGEEVLIKKHQRTIR